MSWDLTLASGEDWIARMDAVCIVWDGITAKHLGFACMMQHDNHESVRPLNIRLYLLL